MSTFLENLWTSVFTPGTTPTLLIATNVTFGALQLLLFALLLATYSVHFIILSFLCGGLWWSINWFAREVVAAQRVEEEAERLRKRREGAKEGQGDVADDEGEDTEVEGEGIEGSGELVGSRMGGSGLGRSAGGVVYEPEGRDVEVREEVLDALKASGSATAGSGVRRREAGGVGDQSGDLSTDSEWEKVGGHQ